MTTDCLPCEEQRRLARTDIQGGVPDDGAVEARWSGPIGIENMATGDGRFIETNALRWDTLPIPLRWAMQDFGAHDGAYVVGLIEEIDRIDYKEANRRLAATGREPLTEDFKDAVIIWGAGSHDLGGEYGREAFRQVDKGYTPGISMDLDDIVVREEDGDSFSITEGRIRAATQVAIPAFEGARIAVAAPEHLAASGAAAATASLVAALREVHGGGSIEVSEALLDDALERGLAYRVGLRGDGAILYDLAPFNWVEDVGGLPKYIKRIKEHLEKKGMTESHAVATAVNVVTKMCATGDTNFPGAQEVNAASRAEACAAVAEWEEKKARAHADAANTLVASAGGKWTPPRAWFNDPGFHPGDPRMVQDIHGNWGAPLHVEEDGRVWGHIALWGTCHTASPQGQGVCTRPPRSPSGYSNFHLGSTLTDSGLLPTGKITMNTLHAGQRLNMVDALHHYEHTGLVAAHVRAGEDEFGIWVAGAALPGADLVALRAAPVSGDWRARGGALDLVAALSVNVPGFPVPRATALVAGGSVQSLVASGVVAPEAAAPPAGMGDAELRALRDRFRAMDRADAAAALAARVARLDALERVRRFQIRHGVFAYNPDQWRVPKGNPEGGRWVDMPSVGVNNLDTLLHDLADNGSLDDTAAADVGDWLENALDQSENLTRALNDGDGSAATQAANNLDEELSGLETALQNAVDGGGVSDEDAARLGDALDQARSANDLVRDSDLSLLGDEGVGGDSPETDIGGGDEGVVGDAPTVADPQGEDPLSVADVLGEAGLDPDVIDRVTQTGWIQDPNDMSESGNPSLDDSAWPVLNALPEGTEIVTGQEPLNANYIKDSSAQGGWRLTEIGPGLGPEDFPYEVGDGLDDPRTIDGGGDNDIYLKSVGDNVAQQANGGESEDSKARDDYWAGFEKGIPEDQKAKARKEFDDVLDNGGTIEEALEAARGPQTKARNEQDSKDRDNYWNGFKRGLDPEDESKARKSFDDVLDNGGSIDDALKAAREQVEQSRDDRYSKPEPTDADAPNDPDAPPPPDDKVNPDATTEDKDSDAPPGVSQAEWDQLSPEEKKIASSAIAAGDPPRDAMEKARASGGGGSAQQRAAMKVSSTVDRLEQTVMDAAEGPQFPEEQAPAVGDALDALLDAVEEMTSGVQNGSSTEDSVFKAQAALQKVEQVLMAAAEFPGMDDLTAGQIGQALDDLFADMGTLTDLLKGETAPPPFAHRKYVRQWLGRRGIRIGRKPAAV